MGQSAFFLISFLVAGSVLHLVNLWDAAIESELQKVRRERRNARQARARRQQDTRNRYRRYQYSSRGYRAGQDGYRRTYSHPRNRKGSMFYCRVLGISAGTPPADIKKKYRGLVVKYHPDKLQQTSPEYQELAENRIKEINEAYDYFRKKYRFS